MRGGMGRGREGGGVGFDERIEGSGSGRHILFVFHEVLKLCGGPVINQLKTPGGSAKEKTLTCVEGGRGWGGSWDHTSSGDVGPYEIKRTAGMQMGIKYELMWGHLGCKWNK